MSPLAAWLLVAMTTWCPTSSRWRLEEYSKVAMAIAVVTTDVDDATLLASIGSYESGYALDARNPRTGAWGVWQLMSPHGCGARDLVCQARVALERAHFGMCSYTGEAANPASSCPLARERLNRATIWTARHAPP